VPRGGKEEPRLEHVALALPGGQEPCGQREEPEGQGAEEGNEAALGGGDAEGFLGDPHEAAAHVAEAHDIERQKNDQ
jgi:hypothetical protein